MEAASLSLNLTTNATEQSSGSRDIESSPEAWGSLGVVGLFAWWPERRRGYAMLLITQITAPSPRAALWQERAARPTAFSAAAPAAG